MVQLRLGVYLLQQRLHQWAHFVALVLALHLLRRLPTGLDSAQLEVVVDLLT